MVQQAQAELQVTPRDVLGKKVRRLRREGLMPANVYGRGLESVAIQVTRNDLVHVLRTAGRNEIIYLRLDGDELRPTFLRQVQRNPITDAILHVDFYQISLKEKVQVEVSGLEEIDATVSVAELNVPGQVTVLTDIEQVVAKVAPPHVEKVEEEVVKEAVEGEAAEKGEEAGKPGAEADEAGQG